MLLRRLRPRQACARERRVRGGERGRWYTRVLVGLVAQNGEWEAGNTGDPQRIASDDGEHVRRLRYEVDGGIRGLVAIDRIDQHTISVDVVGHDGVTTRRPDPVDGDA